MSSYQTSQNSFIDYLSFQIPEDSFPEIANCIGIARGFMNDLVSVKKGYTSLEAVLLCVPDGYHCMDLSLYKVKTLNYLVQSYGFSFFVYCVMHFV